MSWAARLGGTATAPKAGEMRPNESMLPGTDQVAGRRLRPYEFCFVAYDPTLTAVGKVALLCEQTFQLYHGDGYRYAITSKVADQVYARCGVAALSARGGGHPVTPVTANVGAETAREIDLTAKPLNMVETAIGRVADAGEDHSLSVEEARGVVRRSRYSVAVGRALALKGYRFEVGQIPKYVSKRRLQDIGGWLADIETEPIRAVEFVGYSRPTSTAHIFAASRPHLVEAYVLGAFIDGADRALAGVVIEDRELWLRAVKRGLEWRGDFVARQYGLLRTHPHATFELFPLCGYAGVVSDEKEVCEELADYVLGRYNELPANLVTAARRFMSPRMFGFEYGHLRQIRWPEGTFPESAKPYEVKPAAIQREVAPVVEYPNRTLGDDEAAWGRFAALAAQIVPEVTLENLVGLA